MTGVQTCALPISLNFVTAMQNSLILFNASLEHTAPPYDLHEKRYTLVMDLNLAGRDGPRADELPNELDKRLIIKEISNE